jgi:hypothetical protein
VNTLCANFKRVISYLLVVRQPKTYQKKRKESPWNLYNYNLKTLSIMSETNMLKKISGLALAMLWLLAPDQVQAQRDLSEQNFGIKGGLNVSQLYIDQPNAEDEHMKLGYHFGLFGTIPVNNLVFIQHEVLYTNVGSKITYGGADLADLFGIEPGEVRFHLNYVQVPVAVVVNIGPLGVYAGPYGAYLLSAKVKNLRSSDLNTTDKKKLETDDFYRIDYGLVGGLTWFVGSVSIGARYNHGLREIGKRGLAGSLTNDAQNAVVQVYMGFDW